MVSKTIATKSENKGETVPALLATETATNKIKLSPSADEGSGSTVLTLSTVSDKARTWEHRPRVQAKAFPGNIANEAWEQFPGCCVPRGYVNVCRATSVKGFSEPKGRHLYYRNSTLV